MVPGPDGVVVRGQVGWPYEWMTASFTQGKYGYGSASRSRSKAEGRLRSPTAVRST